MDSAIGKSTSDSSDEEKQIAKAATASSRWKGSECLSAGDVIIRIVGPSDVPRTETMFTEMYPEDSEGRQGAMISWWNSEQAVIISPLCTVQT